MRVQRMASFIQLCLLAGILAGCAAEPMIRVRLVHTVDKLTFAPQGEWVVLAGEEQANEQETGAAGEQFSLQARDGEVAIETDHGIHAEGKLIRLKPMSFESVMEIKNVPYGVGWWWEGTQDRTYQGDIEVRPASDGMLEVVLTLPLEEYLKGVVPSEIGADSPLEALKAQAVAARSEALLALETGKYAGAHHDIGSDVDSQAYSGNVKRSEASDEAVQATRGQALYFEGKPMAAFYASSSGGHTEDIRNVWPHRAHEKGYWDVAQFDSDEEFDYDLTKEEDLRRWLVANPDVNCNPDKYSVPAWAVNNFRWERVITADQLTAWVGKKKDIGRVIKLRPIKRGVSGRLIEIEFIGEDGSYTEGPELPIRMVFDPPLKSAAFVVDPTGPEQRPDSFVIRGAGWGHGVGMCQTGAITMARKGVKFSQILKHYYPKATLRNASYTDQQSAIPSKLSHYSKNAGWLLRSFVTASRAASYESRLNLSTFPLNSPGSS